MIEYQEIQKSCLATLAIRSSPGTGSVELYDDAERRRIGMHNLRLNRQHYKALGPKYDEFRKRVEMLVLGVQEPCEFLMEKKDTREEWRVMNVHELLQALREGYELAGSAFEARNFKNPCGEIKIGSFTSNGMWHNRESYQVGGSPYPKLLNHQQHRLIARAVWRRITLASHDAVIVEALPHIKISKSVLTKLEGQILAEPVRELLYAFYNQTRQAQWWQQLRSYRAGLRDATNLRIFALIVADFIYDALGLQAPMPNEWKTTNVLNILKGFRQSENFADMPILADALQDAGCENEQLLRHYRLASSFSLGSWIFRATGLI